MEIELKSKKTSEKPLLDSKISSYGDVDKENSHVKEEGQQSLNNEFKPLVFVEFFVYFLLKAFLGPFSYYFFKRFVTNGQILASNLQLYEGKGAIFGSFGWFMKIYCIISTFVFLNPTIKEQISQDRSGYEYNSTSQFYLLLHTEISLSVLYGAYYASLTEAEIQRLKTEIYDSGGSIFSRVINLIRLGTEKLNQVKNVARSFPEIDLDNFYFIYPKEQIDTIPPKLQPEPLDEKQTRELKQVGIEDGVTVQCDKYATYVAEIGGYQQFDLKIKVIRYSSRGLVFINAILPVINNIYQILADGQQASHIVVFLVYVVQQISYSYLIYRLAVMYDVLFLGLLLYYKKCQMLSLLGEVIKMRPESPAGHKLLPIPTTVPQNIENWLAVRKVLTSINGQAFVVIDINMSFVLLYTMMFITFYALTSLNVLRELFLPFKQFLSENPAIQAVLTLTVIVITIVLIADLALGILINRLFMFEKHEWTLQETVITNLKVNNEVYRDQSSEEDRKVNKLNIYATKMKEIRSLMGPQIETNLYMYLKRIKDSIIMVIKAIDHEEFFNPHTLLGIRTDIRLVVALGTAISAIGVSTIVKIAQNVVNTPPTP